MALSQERINALRNEAMKSIALKTKEAARGHNWVVDSHSMNSFELLELLAVAEVGLPVWLSQERQHLGAQK